MDYKSTSQNPQVRITLDGKWKGSTRPMIFTSGLCRLGIETSDVGYFLYCDGDRFTEEVSGEKLANMQFKMTLIEYESDLSWIEPTLQNIKKVLDSKDQPNHSEDCDYGAFIADLGRC